uniref:YadA family autotransporter adhesin n=1 Tax=Halomonas halocynthiae TaxID=176290 RepID=UPI00047F8043
DGKNGVTINGADGSIGINGKDGANGTITVVDGVAGVDGKDGITRIVIDDKEVATMDDGLNFAGDDGKVLAKKLNEQLDIVGGADLNKLADDNIGVVEEGGKLNIKLANNIDLGATGSVTTGNTVMNDAGVNVDDGAGSTTEVGAGSISVAGAGNSVTVDGSNGTIEGLTNTDLDGSDFAQAGRAATEEQLKQVNDVANTGWDVSANGSAGENVAPGAKVDFSNTDDNILISQDGTDLAFNLNKDLTVDSVTTGNTRMADGGIFVTNGDATDPQTTDIGAGVITLTGGANGDVVLNNGGLNNGHNKIVNVANGDVSSDSKDAINGSQLWQVKDVANAGWNLTTNGEEASASNVAPRDTVDFAGDGNVLVSNEGNDISVALADKITLGEDENAIAVDGENGLLSVGDKVALDKTGLVIANGGPSVTINGIYAGNKQITGVASGLGNQSLGQVSGDDLLNAVNVGDLKQVAGDINKDVAAAKTEVTQGKNITVKESLGDDGQTVYEVATADDVEFDSIDVGSVTIDKNNVDNEGNTIISGVGKGEVAQNSTDAVNGSQLWEMQNDITNITEKGGKYFKANSEAAAANPVGQESVAMGPQSVASGDDSVAAGNGAVSKAQGSVALGAGSVADREGMNGKKEAFSNVAVASQQGAISVGNQGGERQITNVAGGTQDTDAVNVRQLKSVEAASVNYDRNDDGSIDYGNVTLGGGGDQTTVIHNVAAGKAPTDAANVGQLQDLNQRFTQELGGVKRRISDLEDDSFAGVASAIAASSVPQTTRVGKGMVAVGAGTYKGESAVAVGVSRLSENGHLAIKLNVTGDSQGNFGAGVGAGWHW